MITTLDSQFALIQITFLALLGMFCWLAIVSLLDKDKESGMILWLGLLMGTLSFGVVYIINHFGYEFLNKLFNNQTALLFFSAFHEEFIKIIFFILFVEISNRLIATKQPKEEKKKYCFDELSDGIIYSLMISLGFVLLENIFYFLNLRREFFYNLETESFWLTYNGRLIFSSLGHIVFTGVFGFYYAMAYLSDEEKNKFKKEFKNIKELAEKLLNLSWKEDIFLKNEKGKQVKEILISIKNNYYQYLQGFKEERFLLLVKKENRLKPYDFNILKVIRKKQGKNILKKLVIIVFKILTLHILRNHFFKEDSSDQGHSSMELILEGFYLAILTHFLYNYFLENNLWIVSFWLVLSLSNFFVKKLFKFNNL